MSDFNFEKTSICRATQRYIAIGLTTAIIAAASAVFHTNIRRSNSSQTQNTKITQENVSPKDNLALKFYDKETGYGKNTFDKLADYFIDYNRIFSDGIVDMLTRVVPKEEVEETLRNGNIKSFEDLLKKYGDIENGFVQGLEEGNVQASKDTLVDMALTKLGIEIPKEEGSLDNYGKVKHGLKYYLSGIPVHFTNDKFHVFFEMLAAFIPDEKLEAAARSNDVNELEKLFAEYGDDGSLIPTIQNFSGSIEDAEKVANNIIRALSNYVDSPNYKDEWIFPDEDAPYLKEPRQLFWTIADVYPVLYQGMDDKEALERQASLRENVYQIGERKLNEHGPFSFEEEMQWRMKQDPERAHMYLEWIGQYKIEHPNEEFTK